MLERVWCAGRDFRDGLRCAGIGDEDSRRPGIGAQSGLFAAGIPAEDAERRRPAPPPRGRRSMPRT